MKFNFKKVASVLASAIMLSSTVGFAAAATYPAPFVVSGTPDGAVVVGANAAATDWASAVDISTDLSSLVSSVIEETTSVGGDVKSLASGSDLVYLNDDLAENVATITDSDLATVLADGTFTDDDGTNYEYEQTITIGSDVSNGLAFTDSSNDLDDPAILVQLTDSTSKPAYTLVVDFKSAVAFNETASEGEPLTLFGKEYTVGTATDGDTLVLLGGASESTINVGESITVEVGGASYEVTLSGISDAVAAQASITINGDSKTFTQGQTKKIAGIDVYAKTIFRLGDNAGHVILQLGSDKLTFENASSVTYGSDNDDIEGTAITLFGTASNEVGDLTKMEIAITAADSDVDHILKGESFVDPIFGTINLDFADLKNGPELNVEVDEGSTRKTLAIAKKGDRELGLTIQTPGNDAVTVPFAYEGGLADDNSKVIHVVEGVDIDDDEYFILNSGNYEYFMKMLKVSLSESSKSDVHFKDLLTGTSYTTNGVDNDVDINETAGTTTTFTINSQTFTVESVDADTVKIYSSDYTTNKAVFPYVKLVDGKDHKVALTNTTTIADTITATSTTEVGSKIYDLPTGNIQFGIANESSNFGYKIDEASSWTTTTQANDTYTIGAVDYVVNSTFTENTTLVIDSISLEASQTAGANHTASAPTILFIEEEDKTEATADTKNAVVLATTDSTTFSECSTPIFSGTSDDNGFDNSKHTGYLTNFGTYILKDASDTDQTVTSLTYSGNQMYGELYVSEVGASITPGSSGAGGLISVFKDTQVSSFSGKNLFIVGGSCINQAAAKVLGSDEPVCGAAFTDLTTVGSSQYILKTVESPYDATKIAMLVAGYEAADTINAVSKAKEGALTDVGTEEIYPKLSA